MAEMDRLRQLSEFQDKRAKKEIFKNIGEGLKKIKESNADENQGDDEEE